MDLLKRPSTDFAAVRDGRQSLPLYIDVDLTTARSISGNNPLILNIAGNSFYTDADTTNGGNAIVHFQDTNLGNASAPFFVSPGFIANVGFTQLLIENTAQAGKRMRIFYGVDIDFQAGVNASIAITGSVNVNNTQAVPANVVDSGFAYTQSYKSTTLQAALTPDTVFLPASNTNGAIVWIAESHGAAAAQQYATFVAKSSAPTTIIDGDVIASSYNAYTPGFATIKLARPVKIAAGKGLYYIPLVAETPTTLRNVLYTLL